MSSERHTEVIRAQLVSKAALSPDQTELYELTQLAGITMDQEIFKIILDLLKMNVPPAAITQTLRSMCSPHKQALEELGSDQSSRSLHSNRADASGDGSGYGDLIQLSANASRGGDGGIFSHQSSSHDRLASILDTSNNSTFSQGNPVSQQSNRSQTHTSGDLSHGRNKSRLNDRSQGQGSGLDSSVPARPTYGVRNVNNSRETLSSSRKKQPFH